MNNASETVHILLVEDNPGDVFLMREALAASGLPHQLHLCEQGDNARDFLLAAGNYRGASPPDLVLLDLNVPRVGGDQLLGILRATPRLSHIPVVIFSSSISPRDRALAAQAGNSLYITKPSDLDEFLAVGSRIRSFWETSRKPGPAPSVS